MNGKILNIIFIIIYFPVYSQSFSIYKGDTINYIDKDEFKQGHWIYFEKGTVKIVSEGKYLNNKREAIWKTYNKDGVLRSEITYNNGKADGWARTYYLNGSVEQEGLWKVDKWVGNYKCFYENGSVAQDLAYNDIGKKDGVQKYFFESGDLRAEGSFDEGKREGVIKEYYENGSTRSEKVFNNGTYNKENSKSFPDISADKKNVNSSTQDNNNYSDPGLFKGTGYNKVYNSRKKVEQEGDYINGVLIEGKKYIYDSHGNLIRTIIISNGKPVQTVE